MANVVELISDKFNIISLEVSKDNISAKKLYESFGFEIVEDRGQKVLMNMYLKSGTRKSSRLQM